MRISVYSTTEKFPEDPSRETAECENQLKYDLAMPSRRLGIPMSQLSDQANRPSHTEWQN